jgi:hypothetical protein
MLYYHVLLSYYFFQHLVSIQFLYPLYLSTLHYKNSCNLPLRWNAAENSDESSEDNNKMDFFSIITQR